jgi:hypothetical protein
MTTLAGAVGSGVYRIRIEGGWLASSQHDALAHNSFH